MSRYSIVIALINRGKDRFSCGLNIVDSLDVSGHVIRDAKLVSSFSMFDLFHEKIIPA